MLAILSSAAIYYVLHIVIERKEVQSLDTVELITPPHREEGMSWCPGEARGRGVVSPFLPAGQKEEEEGEFVKLEFEFLRMYMLLEWVH